MDEARKYWRVVRELESAAGPPAEGSREEAEALDAFRRLLSDFKAPDFGERISEVYAENAFFDDTLKTLRGSAAIRDYLTESAEALERGTVEFLDTTRSGDQHYLRWRMVLRFRRLSRGKDHESVGMTHLRLGPDGKVLLHKDFWDAAKGLYEHVPVLGWMMRKVRRRL